MQHSYWHKIPMVRILVPFICGISISMFYSISLPIAFSITILFLAFSILSTIFFNAYQQRWFSGFFLSITFFCVGILLHLVQNPLLYKSHFSRIIAPKSYIIMVDEEPIEKLQVFKMRTKVIEAVDSLNSRYKTTGYILLYLDKNSNPLQYGQVLKINANIVKEVSPPKNPDEFNYKRYLAFNHIYYQAYVTQKQLAVISVNNGNPILQAIYSVQHYFKQVLKQYIKEKNEVGVALALVYGFDDEIEQSTLNAYANTGTLHVLAVSGMHVGLILYILNGLLFFMNKNKKLLLAKRTILIVSIWIYSALCGLSPSILRATVMFSFILVSQLIGRKTNIYNTLAASCFVLLCFDTNMLANVGFQLSYMAVIGIVAIQPLLYKWIVTHNWLLDQIWKITSVSIAAQITTTPIGILYFHQFPNCFLFSNLLIIPLTTIILYACIVLLLVSPFPVIAEQVGWLTKHCIAFTNWLVKQVESIPYAYVNGLQIEIIQSIFMYVFFIAIIYYFINRNIILLKTAILSLIIFISIHVFQNFSLYKQQKLIVYSISKGTAIGLFQGSNASYFLDSTMLSNKEKFKFHLQQNIWKNRTSTIDTIAINKNWQVVNVAGKSIVLSGKGNADVKTPDLLIIRYPIKDEQLSNINPKQIIINGSLSLYTAKRIEEYCIRKNISFYNVSNSGAFQLSL